MSERELREAADALRGSVVVAGCGPVGRDAVERLDPGDGVARIGDTTAATEARAAFVGVDLADPSPAAALARACAASGTVTVFVAAVEPRPAAEARTALATLGELADAVVLAPDDGDPAEGVAAGLRTLVRLVAGADAVNVDLADVETVVSAGGFAAVGTATDEDAMGAVEAAVEACGPADLDRATGALVHLAGGETLSVQDAGDAVAAVRDRLAEDSHVIWGAATAGNDEVTARLVLTGVLPVRPPAAAGEPCPRCERPLVGYRMGDRETVACDGCGFADIGASLGGDPLVPGDGP